MEDGATWPLAYFDHLGCNLDCRGRRCRNHTRQTGWWQEHVNGRRGAMEWQGAVPTFILALMLRIREVEQEEFTPSHRTSALDQVLRVMLL